MERLQCKAINDRYTIYSDGKLWDSKLLKFISPHLTCRNKKYYYCTININGKQKHQALHRILAIAFIPNPNNYPCINHIDGNSKNNNLDNLEWCTYSQNTQHAYRLGLINPNIRKRAIATVIKSKVQIKGSTGMPYAYIPKPVRERLNITKENKGVLTWEIYEDYAIVRKEK